MAIRFDNIEAINLLNNQGEQTIALTNDQGITVSGAVNSASVTATGTVQGAYVTASNASGAANGTAQEVARFVNTRSGATSSYMYIGAAAGTDWRLGKNILGTASDTNFGITKHSGTDIFLEIDGSGNTSIHGTIGASNFSGSSSGTNTGDQTLPTLSSLGALSTSGGTMAGNLTFDAGYTLSVDTAITDEIRVGDRVTLTESTDRADLLYINSNTSGWGGLQIANGTHEFIFSLMGNGNEGGIYDDANSDWIIRWDENAAVKLHYNASEKLATTNTGVSISGGLSVSADTVLGNGLTDTAVVHGHLGIGEDGYPKIAYPGKKAQWSGSGSTTGQIVIDLPGTLGNYDMMYMEIDIYNYSAEGATKLIIGGHNWNSGGNSNTSSQQWYNVNVQVIGALDKPIYFGRRNDGTSERRCIAIGETDSTWSYGTVHVSKVSGASGFYTSGIDWVGDWNVDQTTEDEYFTKNPSTNFNSGTTLETNGNISASNFSGSSSGTNTGDQDLSGLISSITVGTGLDGTTSSGDATISLDLSELTDMTADITTTVDELILLDDGAERKKRFSEIFGSAAYSNTNAFATAGHNHAGVYALEYELMQSDNSERDMHVWRKNHAMLSDDGSISTYIIVQTNVPQDSTSMGGFTLVYQDDYSSGGEGGEIKIYGYWNAESNSGFVGFRYECSNPYHTPTIEVCRNSSSGKTAFFISGEGGNYTQLLAKDLWLGFVATSATSQWGDSWTVTQADAKDGYTNFDTLNRNDFSAITTNGSTPSLTGGVSAAEIRTLIGAGTSSFNGAYSSLSSIPSTFAPSAHNHDDRYYTETESDERFLRSDYRANFIRVGYGNSGETRYHKLATITVDSSYDDYNATFEWTTRYASGLAGIHVHSDNDTTADVMGAWYVDWNPHTVSTLTYYGNYIKYTQSGDTVEIWVKTVAWQEFDYIIKDSVTEGTPSITWYTETTTTDTATEPSNLNSFTNNTHSAQGYITSQRAISSTPTDGATTTAISSDWAFDNVKTAVPANAVFTDTVNTFDGAYSSLSGTPTLGTAAAAATGDFATSAQGTTADAALPKAGGTMTGNVLLQDDVELRFGTDTDLKIYHDGANSRIANNTGHLYIQNLSDDKDILFRSDDGSGGTETYLNIDGSLGKVSVSKPFIVTNNATITGTLYTGDTITVGDGTEDSKIIIKNFNAVSEHIEFYNGSTRVGEIGVEDNTWLRINQETNKNIYTPRYIRADAGFFVDGTAKGINGSGNFIGGTITGASDANVSNWDTAYGWGDHDDAGYITSQRAISSTPTDGATTTSISSDWAFDNVKTAVPTNAVFTDTDTVYTHPTTAGNKHIPAGGAAGEFLRYSADGTAVWATPSYTTNTNTTYSAGAGLDLTGTTFSIEPDLRDGITLIGKNGSNYIAIDHDDNNCIDFYISGVWIARMEADGDLHMKGDVIAFSDIFNP